MVLLSDYRVLLFTMSPCDYLCDYLLLVGLPPNTPPQVEVSPISEMCFLCFGRGRDLVRTSAVCSGSQQLSIVTSPFSTSSLTQCHWIAICLLRLWNCWFLAIEIEPLSGLIYVLSKVHLNPIRLCTNIKLINGYPIT